MIEWKSIQSQNAMEHFRLSKTLQPEQVYEPPQFAKLKIRRLDILR